MNAIEQGPIRPPSEAQSLLLRVTRNCSWNKCEFCHIYKEERFSLRSVEEIKRDIDNIKGIVSEIITLSRNMGFGGEIKPPLASAIMKRPEQFPQGFRSILLWLYNGGKNVFLQDANNLALKTANLVEILNYLKAAFPSIERITTYSRARTVAKKSVADLKEIHDAGLSRIHMGLETGYDPLLKMIQKGLTAQEQIQAGRKVKEAGISLSEYIMPGLGGKKMWREHALATADVLNQIDPDFIRVRTLKVLGIMPLQHRVDSGELELMNDDEIIAEMKLLIESLDGITSQFVSDHSLNLLEELEGKFPEAKSTMLAAINRYLGLDKRLRDNFRLGKRAGYYRSLSDLEKPDLRIQVDQILDRIEAQHPGKLDDVISEMMESFI
jgi:radical SAM superfamily enzyme YgiQ (UPF0313 family)